MRLLLLTALLTLAACGLHRQPAPPPKSADEIKQLISIADTAFVVAQKVYAGAPAEDVQAATREMLVAMDAARAQTDEILKQVAEVDHLAEGTRDPAGVSSCISLQRTALYDIESMSPDAGMIWSTNVSGCAANAIVYFENAPAEDSGTLALALTIIDPILLAAGTRGGMKRGALMHYRDSNASILEKLGPECAEKAGNAAAAGQVSYRCAAYEVAKAMQPKLQPLADQLPTSP